MSKQEEIYEILRDNTEKYLLFKYGAFYIFMDEHAEKMSDELGFKITYLNSGKKKCGFPVRSIDKYEKIFADKDLKVEIIDEPGEYLGNLKKAEIQKSGKNEEFVNYAKQILDLNIELADENELRDTIQKLQNKLEII